MNIDIIGNRLDPINLSSIFFAGFSWEDTGYNNKTESIFYASFKKSFITFAALSQPAGDGARLNNEIELLTF